MQNINMVQLVESLCAIIDQQTAIIKTQALALAEYGAVSMAAQAAEIQARYTKTIGDEVIG